MGFIYLKNIQAGTFFCNKMFSLAEIYGATKLKKSLAFLIFTIYINHMPIILMI